MEFGGPTFVLLLVAMSFIGWIVTTAIRARHGCPIENEWGGTVKPVDKELQRQNELLERENQMLRDKMARLEERTAVLERITTDPAERLSNQIEGLR